MPQETRTFFFFVLNKFRGSQQLIIAVRARPGTAATKAQPKRNGHLGPEVFSARARALSSSESRRARSRSEPTIAPSPLRDGGPHDRTRAADL